MKRSLGFLAVVVLVCVPIAASAASFGTGSEYFLGTQERVGENLYVAAGTSSVGGQVEGDLIIGGGSVAVTGRVADDLLAGGGTVELIGPVGGDVRVVGGQVTVGDRVGGDLVVLGGTIRILPGATVNGDVYVAGGQLTLDGTVAGSVRFAGGTLSVNGSVKGDIRARVDERLAIGSSAVVGGSLLYRAPREFSPAQGAAIGGVTRFEPVKQIAINAQVPRKAASAIIGILTGISLLTMLGLAALLVWKWRRPVLETMTATHETFLRSLGRGLVFMVLGPIAVILLLISFVGILPGVLLAMLLIMLSILAKVVSGMFIGAWVVKAWKRSSVLGLHWGSALGGVILMECIGIIPVLGWLVRLGVFLAVFGAVTQRAEHQLFAK